MDVAKRDRRTLEVHLSATHALISKEYRSSVFYPHSGRVEKKCSLLFFRAPLHHRGVVWASVRVDAREFLSMRHVVHSLVAIHPFSV